MFLPLRLGSCWKWTCFAASQGKHRITFSGGGHSYEYATSSSSASGLEMADSFGLDDTFDFEGNFELTFKVIGIKLNLKLGGQFQVVRSPRSRSRPPRQKGTVLGCLEISRIHPLIVTPVLLAAERRGQPG